MSRKIVDDVLGPEMTRKVWSGNYDRVLPISINEFELSAVLPAIFYMFRRGFRRGKGKFITVYGADQGSKQERRRSATIDRVATILAQSNTLDGFRGEAGHAILGDLLLCYCLENVKHALGRNEQVQRVAPTHYMSSWIDLPETMANLRFVPEMIVSLLADQKQGDWVQPTTERTWFAVGKDFRENALLKVFHTGVTIQGEAASRTSDVFIEETPIGIDQLLMVRLAQTVNEAPDKMRGGEGERISNQRPIAEQASRHFSEDIRRFLRMYAEIIPRQTLVPMLESCMATGLGSILTSSIDIVLEWSDKGEVRKTSDQKPAALFFDCSNHVDRNLRSLSEQSFEDFMRRINRFPVALMCLRLLDYTACNDPKIRKQQPVKSPFATEWINMLGSILRGTHEQSGHILYYFEQKTTALADKLRQEFPEISELLENADACPNPIWRMSEALSLLMGHKSLWANFNQCIDSSFFLGRPNGFAVKRRVRQTDSSIGPKTREIRSLIISDTALDYLVHLHVLNGKASSVRALSLKEFLRIIRHRYGFCVDEAPPGMSVSNDLLQMNRRTLEKRLRDLGLLEGVNDAEAMKRLTPRFELNNRETHASDH